MKLPPFVVFGCTFTLAAGSVARADTAVPLAPRAVPAVAPAPPAPASGTAAVDLETKVLHLQWGARGFDVYPIDRNTIGFKCHPDGFQSPLNLGDFIEVYRYAEAHDLSVILDHRFPLDEANLAKLLAFIAANTSETGNSETGVAAAQEPLSATAHAPTAASGTSAVAAPLPQGGTVVPLLDHGRTSWNSSRVDITPDWVTEARPFKLYCYVAAESGALPTPDGESIPIYFSIVAPHGDDWHPPENDAFYWRIGNRRGGDSEGVFATISVAGGPQIICSQFGILLSDLEKMCRYVRIPGNQVWMEFYGNIRFSANNRELSQFEPFLAKFPPLPPPPATRLLLPPTTSAAPSPASASGRAIGHRVRRNIR